MTHIIIDILRNSILVTGLVVIMMMMIESFNIESKGRFFSGLRSSKTGQVIVGALLGSIPGCMGGFATVSLYTHGLMSFGALIAMMIASSGDEAFVMLAMIPDKAMLIFVILFAVAVAAGMITDLLRDRRHKKHCSMASHENCIGDACCVEGYTVHPEDNGCRQDSSKGTDEVHSSLPEQPKHRQRHFGWKRAVMFAGVAIFIAALAGGRLEHSHEHPDNGNGLETGAVSGHNGHTVCAGTEHGQGDFTIELLSEDWMNVLFAALSLIVLAAIVFGSDHFVEEHLWKHIIAEHLPGIFLWTFGVLAFIGIGMHYIDIGKWISGNTSLMILLAAAVGIIPESGPHLVFVTLYAGGIVPLPVLLASCISQDGHASLPLLAESKSGFVKAKAINVIVALAVGFASMLFI